MTAISYVTRGAARTLLECQDSEVLIVGSAGTGKSMAMLYKIHLACLITPNVRALVVRRTHASLTGTTLVTFEHKVAAEAIASGAVKWFGGNAREQASYRYCNGSTIRVGGLDRPGKFLSAELDIIAIDEATEVTETALETLITRLRGTALSKKQIMMATNPGAPTHWLKQRADRGSTRLLTSLHRDNPAYVNDDGTFTSAGTDYMAKLDALTGVRRLRLRDGIWAAAEGVIYEEYSEAVNLIDHFEPPQSWVRWWAIDWGFTNPFVLGCWAEDPDGRLYLYREIYRTKRLVEDHARHIISLVTDPETGRWTEPKPRAIICDHDAEDRATFERHVGLSTVAANKAVSVGIQAVQARIRPAGDGKPRLFVMRDSLVERDPDLEEAKKPCCTAEEFPGYIWAVKPGGAMKEEPVKQDDHGMDALRYITADRDLGARPRVRFL